VGTVNLDMRSLWLNFEVTLVVDDKAFTEEMVWLQHQYIEQSHPLDKENWSNRSLTHRFLERAFFLFSPIL
jgi:cardiolipin synthase